MSLRWKGETHPQLISVAILAVSVREHSFEAPGALEDVQNLGVVGQQ
jgi:hypothetical protein